MIQFQQNGAAIYLQIADYILEKILSRVWISENKIPSVRELAVQLEVNPNTVMRSYEWLKQHGVIVDKRGIGFFVCTNAEQTALNFRQQKFFEQEAPHFFKLLHMLQLTPEDLNKPFEQYLNNQSS